MILQQRYGSSLSVVCYPIFTIMSISMITQNRMNRSSMIWSETDLSAKSVSRVRSTVHTMSNMAMNRNYQRIRCHITLVKFWTKGVAKIASLFVCMRPAVVSLHCSEHLPTSTFTALTRYSMSLFGLASFNFFLTIFLAISPTFELRDDLGRS